MAEELHVVFGGGQVGKPLARILVARGKRVRIVKRSAGGVPEGVELRQGDATNPNFCMEAARGAATVYHCMNPSYYARIWAELVPRYMENLIAAAGGTGARLVVLDNVYMLGDPRGRPLNEDTTPQPCSRKGAIRARAAERMWEAAPPSEPDEAQEKEDMSLQGSFAPQEGHRRDSVLSEENTSCSKM